MSTGRILAIVLAFCLALPALGQSQPGSAITDVAIPDATTNGPGDWARSSITISGAPSGALVTGIDVCFRCVHPFSGDLIVSLDSNSSPPGPVSLWAREGGPNDNPTRCLNGITAFNGLTVNRTWYLHARDMEHLDTGYIDVWSITVYYVPPPPQPSITSVNPPQPVATGSSQSFTITGTNFTSTATVDLEDVTDSEQYYNRTVSSRSGSTGIAINPNFGSETTNHSWRVRVNNGATSSSWFNFTVVPFVPPLTIASVSPSQPVATGSSQPFTIIGTNFTSTATVDLEDVTDSEQYYNRTVSSRSGSTGITINPNFGSETINHSWRVRVNNGPTSSNWFNFTVLATPVVGACCLSGSNCTMSMTQTTCQNQGGAWQGPNSTSCPNCPPVADFPIGTRIRAAASGINVRDSALASVLFTQEGGVHGTIVTAPIHGTAGGFTGNWYRINWDSQPPSQGTLQGWSAESGVMQVPPAGDVPQPDLLVGHYTVANIFWQAGFAPASTNPPTPRLGSALGNCTWYAHGRLRQLGYNASQLNSMSGDANEWNDQAIAGVEINAIPTVGCIAQSDAQNHVAVVESINADGTITVTESSYVPNSTSVWNVLWRHRTVAPTWFERFIHVDGGCVDTAPPSIIQFGATPHEVSPGSPVTVMCSVADVGCSGLNRIELWRSNIDGTPSDSSWTQLQMRALSGNGPVTGSFIDTPAAAGTYWYGIHVIDNAGNLIDERALGFGPIRVVVQACRADFNVDGSRTLQDLFDFLTAYLSVSPAADFNGVGGVSLQDVFDYLGAYFDGCP